MSSTKLSGLYSWDVELVVGDARAVSELLMLVIPPDGTGHYCTVRATVQQNVTNGCHSATHMCSAVFSGVGVA